MRLRTHTDSELIDFDFDAYVHGVVQTAFQKYIDEHGRRPRKIYLNHFYSLALGRHAWRLVNKPFPFMTLDRFEYSGVPVVLEDRPYLFE